MFVNRILRWIRLSVHGGATRRLTAPQADGTVRRKNWIRELRNTDIAMPKITTLIGSDKGGVGKSLVAQLIVHAYDRVGMPLSVIEIDHQRKLTSVLADRVDLSLDASPSLSVTHRDRRHAEEFFNPVYEKWCGGDSLTDLGANVTTPLMEWARINDIQGLVDDDRLHFRFVAMTAPDDQAIRSATKAVQEARRALGADAEIFIVLNDSGSGSAGFKPFEGTNDWRNLMALSGSHGARLIHVPLCDSQILEYGRALGYTILDILTDDKITDHIQSVAKLDRISLRTHCRRLVQWVQDVQGALTPLLEPLPEETAEKRFAVG